MKLAFSVGGQGNLCPGIFYILRYNYDTPLSSAALQESLLFIERIRGLLGLLFLPQGLKVYWRGFHLYFVDEKVLTRLACTLFKIIGKLRSTLCNKLKQKIMPSYKMLNIYDSNDQINVRRKFP